MLLRGVNARSAATTFDQWLAAGVRWEETMDPYEKATNTRTDLQSITPPFIPAEAEVMIVRIGRGLPWPRGRDYVSGRGFVALAAAPELRSAARLRSDLRAAGLA